MTTAVWTVLTADPDPRFYWSYGTWDVDGPLRGPAGYILNGVQFQLSVDAGPDVQSGFVSGISIDPSGQFGF